MYIEVIHCVLSCIVAPRIIPFSFGESPIFAGQTAQVTCTVSEGDAPLGISWTFHGPQEMSQLGITTTKVGMKTSLLLIDYASSHHRGSYTCTAKNPAGSTNYSTLLNIHGILWHVAVVVISLRMQ